MAQSLNKTVEFQTTGVSYLGMGNKVGKFLVGDQALEFYNDKNVNDYIQIPWTSINQIGANVSRKKLVVTLRSLQTKENFYSPLKTLERY
ncbi:Mannose operon ManO protein [Streptococcus agalactiae]|nr:Mannose operon ManO protein [Streptococcus agalactiae]